MEDLSPESLISKYFLTGCCECKLSSLLSFSFHHFLVSLFQANPSKTDLQSLILEKFIINMNNGGDEVRHVVHMGTGKLLAEF